MENESKKPVPKIKQTIRKEFLGDSMPSFDPDPGIPFEPDDLVEFSVPGRRLICAGSDVMFYSDDQRSPITVVRLTDGVSYHYPNDELIISIGSPNLGKRSFKL